MIMELPALVTFSNKGKIIIELLQLMVPGCLQRQRVTATGKPLR